MEDDAAVEDFHLFSFHEGQSGHSACHVRHVQLADSSWTLEALLIERVCMIRLNRSALFMVFAGNFSPFPGT